MIYNTVDSLIEAVGRTRSRRWSDLDTLTCIWTGPTALADTSPGMGATHPVYSNMEINQTRKISDVAGITKIELTYVGLFDGGDIGPIARGTSSNESELEYQSPEEVNTGIFFQSAGNFNPTTGQITGVSTLYMWKLFTRSAVIRYNSLNNTFRYVAKGASGPRFGGGSIINATTRPGGQTTPTYAVGDLSGPLHGIEYYLGFGPWGFATETFCSSFQADPISPSWFRCSETWSARYIPGGF
jgi:hypothetical protein